MLSFSLGPLVLALNHLLLLAALALATLVGWISGRRQKINPERALFGLFLLGLVVARVAFVVVYWPQYQAHPLAIIDIRDGGFHSWPGVAAIFIGALLHGWRHPALRKSMGMGVGSGLLFWWVAGLGLTAQQQDTRLPELTLHNGAGQAVRLSDYLGKPLVINLWATWCPPCRREMPVLQAAQQTNPDVVSCSSTRVKVRGTSRLLSHSRVCIWTTSCSTAMANSRSASVPPPCPPRFFTVPTAACRAVIWVSFPAPA